MYGCNELCIHCFSHSPCGAWPHTTTTTTTIPSLSLPSVRGLIILYLPIAKRKHIADALPSRSVCRDTRYFSNACTAKNGWLFVHEQNTQSARAVSKRSFVGRGAALSRGCPGLVAACINLEGLLSFYLGRHRYILHLPHLPLFLRQTS